MKKFIIAIASILAFILAMTYAVQFGKFWWIVLLDTQRPDFVTPTGNYVSGPNALVQNSTVTITWTTADKYEVNSIYFKKGGEKFPNIGGQDVTIEYDVATKLYNYSAQFIIGLPSTTGQNRYPQYLEPGQYTYQVWGNVADYSKQIASPVLGLDVPT